MKLEQRIRLLRLFLAVAAFGWGISILGVFLPWSSAREALIGLGATDIPLDPMLNYWLRMAAGGFFIIGVMFGVAAWNPEKYQVIIPLLGWLSILEGIILTTHGLILGLQPFPFYGDISFCLFIGIGIVILQQSQKKKGIAINEENN
jgi:hypothetical protein